MTSKEFVARCHYIDPKTIDTIDGYPVVIVGFDRWVYVQVDAGMLVRLQTYLQDVGAL